MKTPFDFSKLARLMKESAFDMVVANTRHNVRYLSGGYYYHFHEYSSRMGLSQYLPFLGIVDGRLEDSFYIRRPDEKGQLETEGLWVPNQAEALRGTLTSASELIKAIRRLGLEKGRIGIELPFMPADAYLVLRKELPYAVFEDATPLFDELRAIKTKKELETMRGAYARLAESIKATFSKASAGITTKRLERMVSAEMAERNLSFIFALICAGPGFLRAPSESVRWNKGAVLHIDAGGLENDYVADICRMGCLGEPSALAKELHAACLEVQNAVRGIVRPGIACGDVFEFGKKAAGRYSFSEYSRFVVHGIGMVPYEQPSFERNPSRPLEAGMVISIETDFLHPQAGHVKIEDAVAVTGSGCEGLGDLGRDWSVL